MDKRNIYAQALYDFLPGYADELSVKSGEILQILYDINQDWVYVKSLMVNYQDSNLSGILPINYMHRIEIPEYIIQSLNEFDLNESVADETNSYRLRLFVAKEEFNYEKDGDLAFQKGELIVGQRNINDDWIFGYYLNDPSKTGIFPSNYVSQVYLNPNQIEKPTNSTTTNNKSPLPNPPNQSNKKVPTLRQAKAIHQFDYSDSSDSFKYLKLNVGDYILVTSAIDENWLSGENYNGEKGIFPSKYVEYLSDQLKTNKTQIYFKKPVMGSSNSLNDLSIYENDLKKNSELNLPVNNLLQNTKEPANLNRTQRKYLTQIIDKSNNFDLLKTNRPNSFSSFDSQSDPFDQSQSYNDTMVISNNETKIEPVKYNDKYCVANYDFQPENERELGCLNKEYLKVIELQENSEWIKVENSYGFKGYVPLNHISFLNNDDPNALALFESRKQSIKINHPVTNETPNSLRNSKVLNQPQKLVFVDNQIDLNTPPRTIETNFKESLNTNKFPIGRKSPVINHKITTLYSSSSTSIRLDNEHLLRTNNHINDEIKSSSESINSLNETNKNLLKPNSISERSKMFENIIESNSKNVLNINRSKTPELTENKKLDPSPRSSSYRPPIPPKPRLVNIIPSNSTNTNIETQTPNVIQPRPVLLSKDIASNKKLVESIIKKQRNETKNCSDVVVVGKIQINKIPKKDLIPQISIAEDSIQQNNKDLCNMKDLFTESNNYRQKCGLADLEQTNQIDFNEKLADEIKEVNELSNSQLSDENSSQNSSQQTLSPNELNESQNERKLAKKRNERIYSINELFITEKDYLNEINLCYEAFMSDEQNPPEFDKYELFEELKLIAAFSQHFIGIIESEMILNDDTQSKIGNCFIESAEDMKIVYAKYLENHTNITKILKSYQSNQEITSYITSRLDTIRDKVKVAELATLLIKPVQRIFKYPLFLKRILENTETSHLDYKNLEKAFDIVTKILEFINDYKRRKELVSKYLDKLATQNDYSDLNISDLIKKINLKSLRKKTTRISMQLSTIFGLYNSQVFDENFQREEVNFRLVEKSLRKFFTDLNEYLLRLKEVLNCELIIFDDLLYLFDDDFKTFSLFQISADKIFKVEFQKYIDMIIKSVLSPLNNLLNSLNGPNRLVDKRNDKLVDYEAILADFKLKASNGPGSISKEFENKFDQTKKDYMALNTQLLEELPQLTRKSTKILSMCIRYFCLLTRKFFNLIRNNLNEQIEKSSIRNSNSLAQANAFINNLIASFAENKPESVHIQASSFTSFYVGNFQTEENRQYLKRKYPSDKLYIVYKEYVANEKLYQLKQNLNDIVGLIKPYDPTNQKHIWLVDNGVDKPGFIPCDVLAPYIDPNSRSSILIEIEDVKKNESVGIAKSQDSSSNRNSNDHSDLLNTDKDLIILDDILEKEFCIALFSFNAFTPNMIDLKEGEIYQVLEKADKKNDSEWWLLEYNGKTGYAPCSYVKLLE